MATESNDSESDENDEQIPEFLQELPEDAIMYMEDLEIEDHQARPRVQQAGDRIHVEELCCFASPEVKPSRCIVEALARKLLMIDRPRRCTSWTARKPPHEAGKRAELQNSQGKRVDGIVLVATTGAEGVLDTGASRTVVGHERVKGILDSLGEECRKKVRKVKSHVTFRFGNSGTLDSKHALLIPTSAGAWIRVEIVPGSTPLLISNRLLKEIDAVIHVRKGLIEVAGSYVQMRFDQKGLSIVDFAELLQHTTAEAHHATTAHAKTDRSRPQQQTPADGAKDPGHHKVNNTPQPSADQSGRPPRSPSFPLTQSSRHAEPSREEGHVADARESEGPPQHGGGAVGRRGRSPGRAGGPLRVREGDVHPAAGHKHTGGLGKGQVDGRQTPRPLSRTSFRAGPRLRAVDSAPRAEGALGAELPELRQSQTPKVSESPSSREDRADGSDGQDRQDQGQSKEHRQGRLGVPARDNPDKRARQEADREERQQPGHEDRRRSRGVGASESAPATRALQHPADRGAGAAAVEAAPDRRLLRGGDLRDSRATFDARTVALCETIDGRISEIERQLQHKLTDSQQSKYVMPNLDVLEITTGVGNAVSSAIKRRGGRAMVFNNVKQLGIQPASTSHLWKILQFYEPKHVWIDVQHPWQHLSGQSHWPAELLAEIFLYQMENGRHFHINGGPSFFKDMPAELWVIQEGTLQLRAGCSRTRMQPHNIIHTTSRKLLQMLDDRIEPDKQQPTPCSSTHAWTPRAPRSARQPGNFTDRVANALLGKADVPLLVSEVLIGEESSGSDLGHDPSRAVQQLFKRRRLNGKQAVPGSLEAISPQPRIGWKRFFRKLTVMFPQRVVFITRKGAQ